MLLFKLSRNDAVQRVKYFFAVCNRASRKERNGESFTFQTMDRLSVSFTVLRNYLHYTGNKTVYEMMSFTQFMLIINNFVDIIDN